MLRSVVNETLMAAWMNGGLIIGGMMETMRLSGLGLPAIAQWTGLSLSVGLVGVLLGVGFLYHQARRRHAAIASSTAQLPQSVDSLPLLYSVFDMQTHRVLYVSPQYEQVWGQSCDTLYADVRTAMASIHPDDRDRLRALVAQASWKQPLSLTFRLVQAASAERWVQGQIVPQCNAEGQPIHLVCTLWEMYRDQSDEGDRHSEPTPLSLSNETRLITGDGWLWIDREYVCHHANDAALTQLGKCDREVMGRSIYEIWGDAAANRAMFQQWCDRGIRGDSFHTSVRYHHPSQGERVFSLTVAPDVDKTQAVIGVVVSLRDVTDLMQVDEAMYRSHAQLKVITDSVSVGLALVSADQRYQFVNKIYEDWLSLDRQTILGKTVQEVVGDQVYDSVSHHIQRALSGQASSFEFKMGYATGRDRYISAALTPNWDADRQQSNGYFVVLYDITDRKQAEDERQQVQDALNDALQKLNFHIENSPLAFVECDTNLRIIRWSKRAETIFGWTTTEIINRSWYDFNLVVEDDAQSVAQVVNALLSGHVSALIHSNRNYRKDGSIIYCEWYNSALSDESGHIISILSLVQDVTHQKQSEMQLQQREQEIRALVEHSPDIICRFDAALRHVYANPVIGTLFGLSAEAVLGKTHAEIGWPMELTEQWQQALRQVFVTGEATMIEFEWVTPAGLRCYQSRLVPERSPNAQIHTVLAVTRDTTESKQVLEAIRQQATWQQLIGAITQRIRQTLDLDKILETAVTEVQRSLQADRALIFHLAVNGQGMVLKEAGVPDYPTTEKLFWVDEHFTPECYAYYQSGQPRIVTDVDTDEWGACLVDLMHELGVKSKIVAPITQPLDNGSVRVWGLLIVHACAYPRPWTADEANLLHQISEQLAIAIQQAELYQKLESANQELQRLSTLDGLTQVTNRRGFDDYLEQEWSRLRREGAPLSLILCDVDYFKRYNDHYGHPAGDVCLQQVAQVLKHVLKRPADLVARYGGEEFVLLLPYTDTAGAILMAQQIQQAIAHLHILHQWSLVSPLITMSMGIASLIPSTDTSPERLVSMADQALYRAKAQGRNCYCVSARDNGSFCE